MTEVTHRVRKRARRQDADCPGVTLITTPKDNAPVIADQAGLSRFIDELEPGAPIAVDAERAHSYRYSSKAYLVQLRQAHCGTRLLDPIALAQPDDLAHLEKLSDALADSEWVLHAASQDLPCLAEIGLVPHRIFDTELAGRLLGLQRVSLSPMLTHFLGIELAKEHSADDWSRRPLPAQWLAYASLDVDYLLELRDAVAAELDATGKAEWAAQEFTDIADRFAHVPQPDDDRWRHTKGMARLGQPRQLGVARALWHVRDQLAQEIDMAPGRILSDAALVDAASALAKMPPGHVAEALTNLTGMTGRFIKRRQKRWVEAVEEVLASDPRKWPARQRSAHNTPPPSLWPRTNPAAAARWAVARPALMALTEKYQVPPENVLTVATLAEIVWPDGDFSETGLRAAMADAHVRPWQQELAAPILAAALKDVAETAHPTTATPSR